MTLLALASLAKDFRALNSELVNLKMRGKNPKFHGQRSKIACFSCFYDTLR